MKLDLFQFMPFRFNRLAAGISAALSTEYQDRYGLDIPEWRVIATLGFLRAPCTAQSIVQSTRTHKSTISRAVTSLLAKQLVERVEDERDRRAFTLQLTPKGAALYQEMIPRMLRRERTILSVLSPQERDTLAALLDKLEHSLDLVDAKPPR
jgi:DNA-binding MarR family transcriptional regulator